MIMNQKSMRSCKTEKEDNALSICPNIRVHFSCIAMIRSKMVLSWLSNMVDYYKGLEYEQWQQQCNDKALCCNRGMEYRQWMRNVSPLFATKCRNKMKTYTEEGSRFLLITTKKRKIKFVHNPNERSPLKYLVIFIQCTCFF